MRLSASSILAAVLLALSSVLAPLPPIGYGQVADGATMTVLKGEVAVVHQDGSAVQPAPSGTTVTPGDQIRTLTKSGALITFFTGTEIELGEDSVMQVERVSRNGEQIDVSLTQVFGTSLHRVHKLTELGSSYRVDVGGAVALVRGTVFAVGYVPPHRVLYVQEGAIDCDQQQLQQGGYWNTGDNGCAGLQRFDTGSSDPWSALAEGLGIAAAPFEPTDSEGKSESQQNGPPSGGPPEEPEEEEPEEDGGDHKNQDKPGHEKNEDNPGHSDKH